ncbi:MAG: Rrf2 family transcriptional regulator [Verrucomicrobiota bacterium]
MRSDFVLALHIMGFLTAAEGKPLSSKILAGTYGTSSVVVRRILAKLNEAGLVTSQRGVGGGTVLALAPQDISLRDVYGAVAERPEILPRYPTNERGPSAVLGTYINDLLGEAEEELLCRLGGINISEMDMRVRPSVCRILHDADENEKKA